MQDHRSILDLFIHQQITNPLKSRCQTALSNLTNYQSSQGSPKRIHNYLPLQQQTSEVKQSPQLAANDDAQSYPSSAIKSESVKSPVFKQARKSVVLEQENQALKSQVELLKNALFELCKDQTLQGALLPILHSVNQQTNIQDQLKIIQQIQNSSPIKKQQSGTQKKHQPTSQPPASKHQQKISFSGNSPSTRAMFETNKTEESNHQQLNQSSLDYSNSPVLIGSTTRSAQRRKRSERQLDHKANSRNYNQIVNKENSPVVQNYIGTNTKSSPSFREDMPLQVNSKKPLATDDTLVFDKSNDLCCVSNNGMDRQIKLSDKTIERIDHLNQDSMAMCSNIEGIMTKDDEEQRIGDASQIQIKYAKMLEELENDDYESPRQNERHLKFNGQEANQHTSKRNLESQTNSNSQQSLSKSQEVKMSMYKNKPADRGVRESRQSALQQTYHSIQSNDDMFGEKQQRYYDSLTKQDLERLTKMSCNVEEKQYYENQLNTLKNELNLFTKEEEKLLQMLEPSGNQRQFEIDSPQLKTNCLQTPGQNVTQDSPMVEEECFSNKQAYMISFQPRVLATHDRERESILVTPVQMNLHNLREFDELCNNRSIQQNVHQEYLTQANLNEEEYSQRHSHQTKNEMLCNLREAFLELKEVLQYQDDDELIRPIKIVSPNTQEKHLLYVPIERMQNTERAKQIPDQLSQKSTERCYEQVGIKEQYQPDNYLASQSSPLKYPLFNSVFSGELREKSSFSLQLHKIKDNKPQKESVLSSHRGEIYQSTQSRLSNIDSQRKSTARATFRSKEQKTAHEVDQKMLSPQKVQKDDPYHQNKLVLSIQKKKNLARDLSRQQLTKCPSQLSLAQQRSLSNTAIKSNAKRQNGNKHQVQVEKKSTQMTHRRDSTKTCDDEEEAPRHRLNKKLQAIDQLVQNTSKIMASDCLKQQVEPEDDEEDIYPVNVTQNFNHNPFKDNSNSFVASYYQDAQNPPPFSNNISISPQQISYYNSIECEERQTLQNHLSQKIEKLNNQPQFFGNYSLEKSELLKQQRNISIKRAEELLEQFLKESQQRPEFVSDTVKKELTKIQNEYDELQRSPKFQEDSLLQDDITDEAPLAAPEMSFQKRKEQYHQQQPSNASSQIELVNLEIGNQRFNLAGDTKHQTLLSMQFAAFQEELLQREYTEPQIISSPQTDGIDHNEPVMELKIYELEQLQSQTQRKQANKHNFSNEQINQNRRKSMGEQNSNQSHSQVNAHQWQSNQQINPPKKRLMQIKKCIGNQLAKSESQGSSNFQSFQANSLSCERNNAKRLQNSIQRNNLLSQTHDNMTSVSSHSQMNSNIILANTGVRNVPTTMTTQNTFIDEPSIMYGHNQLPQKIFMVDPEVLYQQRSKSVIKKREEIISKKMNETQSKLAAKNLKFEQFKQTKQAQQQNQPRKSSNPRGSTSTSTVQSRHLLKEVGRNQRQQVNTLYHSKQKSLQGRSSLNHTPVRANQNEDVSKSRTNLPPSAFYQSNEVSDGLSSLQCSQSKIKLDRKQSQRGENPSIQYQYVPKSMVDLNTPLSQQSNKKRQLIPSTTQVKLSTKLTSDSGSYRKRQSDINEQDRQSQHSSSNFNKTNYNLNEKLEKLSARPSEVCISVASTPMVCDSKSNTSQVFSNNQVANLAPKKKEMKLALKNSIVSRAVRMSKPKEYVQLKHEQKRVKNIISKPNVAETYNQITAPSNHSFISTTKTESSVSCYNQNQRHSSIISQVKEELKSQRSKIQERRLPSNRSGASQQRTMFPVHYANDPIEEYESENRECSSYLIDERVSADAYGSKTQANYQDSQCQNCLRLISKGLSTNFCLEHFGTPRCIDD